MDCDDNLLTLLNKWQKIEKDEIDSKKKRELNSTNSLSFDVITIENLFVDRDNLWGFSHSKLPRYCNEELELSNTGNVCEHIIILINICLM